MELDLLSKKGGHATNNMPGLKKVLEQLVQAIQHDMGGEHSDDPAGTYDAKECNLPIDDAARQIAVCNYPDPNDLSCPDEHRRDLKTGEMISVNPTGVLVQLFADKCDLRGYDMDLVHGLYAEIRILKNGSIQLIGHINNDTRTKQTKFDLIFTLQGGSYEVK